MFVFFLKKCTYLIHIFTLSVKINNHFFKEKYEQFDQIRPFFDEDI